MELYELLLPYLDIDSVSNLYFVDKTWHDYVNRNLVAIAHNTELPVFPTFNEIYLSSFWFANELLHYSVIKSDARLKEIAYRRYATKPNPMIKNYAYCIGLKKHGIQLSLSTSGLTSIKLFQMVIASYDRNSTKFRPEIDSLLRSLLISQDYELVVHIVREDYDTPPYDYKFPGFCILKNLRFREFCVSKGLTDIVEKISEAMIQEVLKQARVTREDAIDSLDECKWDVVNAIMRLSVM